ncbi:MAG: SUF system NifU family Fe-S cluster assembly protein [Chloroflexi bacterium]|nr:SUF system NifU family Fe-S cluster assembly protein [Chloroflexota bacterium]
MSELTELYQEVILDHNRRPRNFAKLESANRMAEGINPLCGDQVVVYLQLDGDRIVDMSFQGYGCAIAKASASLMTEQLKGKSRADADQLFAALHALLTGDPSVDLSEDGLGKLEVLAGVREFPIRVKCATLAWHAMRAALRQDRPQVSTE